MEKDYRITPCIDEETMACYIDGLLSEEEIKQVEEHIAICSRCKEVVNISREIKKQEDTLNF